MPFQNELSNQQIDALMRDSIGTTELGDDKVVDRAVNGIYPTVPTTYTFSYPPGCA